MNLKRNTAVVLVALSLSNSSVLSKAAAPPVVHEGQSYSNLSGKVVLDNERVTVRAFTLPPGQTTGSHTHHDPQLLVFVKGGVLKSESTGRAVLWRDGRVIWLDPSQRDDDSNRNITQTAIKFVEVTLKPVVPAGSGDKPRSGYLSYPNVPTEDVLENDHVIVQRFQLNPGQWEGVHAHNANTLYIFVKGGTGGHWLSRTTNPPLKESGYSPDGDVGWMPAIDIRAGHESSNTGTSPSDVIWIALKD
jgi:quercetin dioxygenase-like cupin family protein